ncbi:M56 family metallopeptidase [Aminipila sp.]|uniref:M56 family metallopeptidase n=1 Tax=Aminipila sp. TaxID=2060095 RepID=UPI00289C8BF2|nr:M56 family metallopeptidase [Aminipila sp.]
MDQNLFHNVIKISLTTSAIIAVLLLLLPLLHKSYTAKWRYFAWLILAVRLLIPFSPSLPQTPIEITPASQNIEFKVPMQQTAVPAPPVSQEITQNLETAPVLSSSSQTITLEELLSIVWALGLLLFMLYHLIGYFLFKKSVLRFSKPIEENHILELWVEIKKEMKIKRSIQLCTCKKVQSPMLIGFFRPFIFLPDSAYSDSDLKIILKHELIHYKRKDIWYKLLLVCANAVHWFNPIVYLMRSVSNKDMEMVCDSELIKDSDIAFRKQYSETILLAIHKGNQKQTAFSTYFYGGKKIMKERFTNIFDRNKKRRGIVALFAVIIVTGLVGLSVAYGVDDSKEGKTIDNIALLSAGNSYDLIDGAFTISYGTEKSAVVPLKPDNNQQSTYFQDKSIYISNEVTAVAYGDNKTPSSPVTVLISNDSGQTWSKYPLAGTKAEDYRQKYIGFTTKNDGWLLLAGDAASGHQKNRIFQTFDGGKTWNEMGNTNDVYPHVVAGAGFANKNIGFVSFQYDANINPVVYRTDDKGKTWTKCSLQIPDSFKSIAAYSTALSPVFNGAKGVLPVTFHSKDWGGEAVDVTVLYETSDYGSTWTFNDKYNLALIWADAWKTRDGRARYEIMNSPMQSKFRAQQGSVDNTNILNYSIRWSSPWVVSYNIALDGDQAVVTYLYTDSTTRTYRSTERLSFGDENGRAVVTGCKTEIDMEEYVNTADWKTVDTGLYTFSIPNNWDAEAAPDGSVSLQTAGEEIGELSILNYDTSQPLSQFEGNHAQTLSQQTLSNCKYPAVKSIIRRTQPAAAEDNSYSDELHIYLIPKKSSYAYDLSFHSSVGGQNAIEVAKNLSINTNRIETQLMACQWAEAVKSRDGKAQYALMSPKLQKKVYKDYQERNWITGQSSPWVDGYTARSGDNNKAIITYTYMTSGGFAGYYRQALTFAVENGQCVISDFSEPKQMNGQNDGTVLAYLNDGKTWLSAETLEEGMFSHMTLSVDGKTKRFPWQTYGGPAFLPELAYADVNGDGHNELIVILCQGEGTGTLIEEIHVLNPKDLSEITVQNPLDPLKNRVSSKIDKNGIKITMDQKKTMTFSEEEVTKLVAERASWFKNLQMGSIVDYSIDGNRIVVNIGAQLSPGSFLGTFCLTYEYTDHQLKVNEISFSKAY